MRGFLRSDVTRFAGGFVLGAIALFATQSPESSAALLGHFTGAVNAIV